MLTDDQVGDILRRLSRLEAKTGKPRAEALISGAGTSFPSSPATDTLFYRTDLDWLCFYDGTRWLTVHEASVDCPVVLNIAANGQVGLIPVRSDYELWITRIARWFEVITTNTGVNFWTVTLRSVNASYGGGSTVDTFNTGTTAVNTWVIQDGVPSATQNPVENNGFDINCAKTGAPGNLNIGVTIFYRLIVP